MHPFPDVYQAFGTSNDHQKPIYVSPGGRKKDTNSPSRKQEKNAPINQDIFHHIANSRFFLINLRTITFARTNHSEKPGEKNHCLGIPTTQMFEKKIHF